MPFYQIAIEETQHWSADVTREVGRCFGLYVFNSEHQVHCCELTPSYELWPVRGEFTREPDKPGFTVDCHQDWHSTSEINYRHISNVDLDSRMVQEVHFDPDPDHTYEQQMEEIVEYLQGNWKTPPGLMALWEIAE